jgi:hypothetical protein
MAHTPPGMRHNATREGRPVEFLQDRRLRCAFPPRASPETSEQLERLANRIGENRVVAGLHYPTDIAQGKVLAKPSRSFHHDDQVPWFSPERAVERSAGRVEVNPAISTQGGTPAIVSASPKSFACGVSLPG